MNLEFASSKENSEGFLQRFKNVPHFFKPILMLKFLQEKRQKQIRRRH
jgi:hypothetical protein